MRAMDEHLLGGRSAVEQGLLMVQNGLVLQCPDDGSQHGSELDEEEFVASWNCFGESLRVVKMHERHCRISRSHRSILFWRVRISGCLPFIAKLVLMLPCL